MPWCLAPLEKDGACQNLAVCKMGKNHSREIHCANCGKDTIVRAEPIYEGFKKIGECFICTGCGFRYPSEEETPFLEKEKKPSIFTEDDLPEKLSVFDDSERRHCCSWCKHFVVSPFSQRCGLTNTYAAATDLCVRFEKKEES